MNKDCPHFVVMKGFDSRYYCRDCDEPAKVTFEIQPQTYGENKWDTTTQKCAVLNAEESPVTAQ